MQQALNMIYGIYFNTALAIKIQEYSQLTRMIILTVTLVLSESTIQVYFYIYNKITIA